MYFLFEFIRNYKNFAVINTIFIQIIIIIYKIELTNFWKNLIFILVI